MQEFNPSPDSFQLDLIEDLLKTSTISAEESEQISKNLDLINYTEAEQLINYLQTKQVNRIHAGLNYNATYVKWFMKKTI